MDKHNQKESFCNKVAAEVLMPQETFSEIPLFTQKDHKLKVANIANVYGVSKQSVVYKLNSSKIIFASFIVTIKFHEDDYYSLNYYSKLGGIPKKEIINLEYEFLKLMDFNLFIKEELYEKYNRYLKSLESEDDDFDIYDEDS